MRKKFITLIAAAVAAVFMLAGCGNTAAGADSNNTADGREAESGTDTSNAVDEETVPKCVHKWTDATFAEPKTCSLCGETEGEPRQSYFEEHGAEVADAPVECKVNAVIFDYFDLSNQKITDAEWKQTACYSEPAEEGYHLVHLELEKVTYLYYDALKFIEYNFCSNESDIYDWYTGRAFPKRQTFQADGFEYGITLEIDGVPYDVSYSHEVKPNYEGWKYDSNGYGTNKGVTKETYIFKIPDGYDGLVFAAVPENEYTGLDTETVDESERYALDENYIEGTIFFRINKEGMVAAASEPAQSPEPDSSSGSTESKQNPFDDLPFITF